MKRMLGVGALLAASCFITLPNSASASVNIMPLGDSITDGVGSAAGGGYRAPLYTDLTSAGLSFTFVGSATDNSGPLPANQQHHEGHPGYRVDQISANLDGNDGTGGNNGGFWFQTGSQPGVILLHIGTNDILQGASLSTVEGRLNSLIQQIFADKPSVDLIVSSIIPIDSGANAEVQQYNYYIQNTIVPAYSSTDHISYVDQYSNFVDMNGNIISGLYAGDGIHPNDAGYALMATTWANGIEALPEPGSLSIIGIGACLLVGRRRRA